MLGSDFFIHFKNIFRDMFILHDDSPLMEFEQKYNLRNINKKPEMHREFLTTLNLPWFSSIRLTD